MMFSKLPVVALAGLLTVASAIPTGGSPSCTSGTFQCCQNVSPVGDYDGNEAFTALLGFLNIPVGNVANVATSCSPLLSVGCNQQALCNFSENGLININGLNCVELV